MNRRRLSQRRPPILLAAVFLALSPAAASGQHHDLALTGLSMTPDPVERTCPSWFDVQLEPHGNDDHKVGSEEVEIRFEWREVAQQGAGGWQQLGVLPVRFQSSDGPFVGGRRWPSDFVSVSGTIRQLTRWEVPAVAKLEVRATAAYLDPLIRDADPTDNSMVISRVTAECTREDQPTIRCDLDPESTHCCVWIREGDSYRCRLRPSHDPIDLCDVMPCLECFHSRSCEPERTRILVDLWPEEFEVQLIAWGQELIAVSEPLPEPLEQGENVYFQEITFFPEPGVEYGIRFVRGPEALEDTSYSSQPRMLQGEEEIQ